MGVDPRSVILAQRSIGPTVPPLPFKGDVVSERLGQLTLAGRQFVETANLFVTGVTGIATAADPSLPTQVRVGGGISAATAIVPVLGPLAPLALVPFVGSLIEGLWLGPRRRNREIQRLERNVQRGFAVGVNIGLPPLLAARFAIPPALSTATERFVGDLPDAIDDLLGDFCPPGGFRVGGRGGFCPPFVDPRSGGGGDLFSALVFTSAPHAAAFGGQIERARAQQVTPR